MGPRSAYSLITACAAACLLGLAAFACSGAGDSSTNGGRPGGGAGTGGGFESDNPSGAAAAAGTGIGTGTGGAGGTGGMGGSGGNAGSGGAVPPADDPNRAIEEADIIQIDSDRLYALSRYGGLSVIDVARPEQLRTLGRYRTEAMPFEMYVKNQVVLGLFTEWGQYVTSGDRWQWVQTSRIVALDTTDPANIRALGEFKVPGRISDSRIVGNILYAVSYQDGSCWECATSQPRTVILSLDVSNPSAVKKVDELVYDDVNDQWGWGARSITVTDQRMYVGGREWRDGTGGSTIQVVDISNPNGDLVPGASVQAEGQITSRWQMDEYQGTLRVLSQPWQGTANPPVLQTYRVDSAQSVVPLARMPLVLPRPEQLQSTRFDGTRAYAITFQRTDPLFTIDLTNPAAPQQMGELEMPGFIYHMEPRGDRLYGLGFDQSNTAGALNVSIFDVSNLGSPRLVDRVNFGANWGDLPEDQDRIHKAFRLLDDHGLIVVPYSGYSYDSSRYCGSKFNSGVQLIDFTCDDLVLRGSAPAFGEARRAFSASRSAVHRLGRPGAELRHHQSRRARQAPSTVARAPGERGRGQRRSAGAARNRLVDGNGANRRYSAERRRCAERPGQPRPREHPRQQLRQRLLRRAGAGQRQPRLCRVRRLSVRVGVTAAEHRGGGDRRLESGVAARGGASVDLGLGFVRLGRLGVRFGDCLRRTAGSARQHARLPARSGNLGRTAATSPPKPRSSSSTSQSPRIPTRRACHCRTRKGSPVCTSMVRRS